MPDLGYTANGAEPADDPREPVHSGPVQGDPEGCARAAHGAPESDAGARRALESAVIPLGPAELRVLVVDDEPAVARTVAALLRREGFRQVDFAATGEEAVALLRASPYDLLFLDLRLPGAGGDEVLDEAIGLYDDEITVVMMTGYASIEVAVNLMKRGAYDLLTKPIDVTQFSATLKRSEQRCWRVQELAGSVEIIEAFARTIETRDVYLEGHCIRVRDRALMMGSRMNMHYRDLKILEYAALLHDVGKLAVDAVILNKAGLLEDAEFEEVKRHPAAARDVLSAVKRLSPIIPPIYHHHERYDGLGYPDGLKGPDIPLCSRIIAVADTFDAMTSHRAYRAALSAADAALQLRVACGSQLDPDAVDLFLDVLAEKSHRGP